MSRGSQCESFVRGILPVWRESNWILSVSSYTPTPSPGADFAPHRALHVAVSSRPSVSPLPVLPRPGDGTADSSTSPRVPLPAGFKSRSRGRPNASRTDAGVPIALPAQLPFSFFEFSNLTVKTFDSHITRNFYDYVQWYQCPLAFCDQLTVWVDWILIRRHFVFSSLVVILWL